MGGDQRGVGDGKQKGSALTKVPRVNMTARFCAEYEQY